jgi:hypothetical protein
MKDGGTLHYVGRTGDSASPRAQSPFSRISGHLGSNKHSNALRRHLASKNIDFESCLKLEFVTYGPIEEEAADWEAHVPKRDSVHALERDLCVAMKAAGYDVINDVTCRLSSDTKRWLAVGTQFAKAFSRLPQA